MNINSSINCNTYANIIEINNFLPYQKTNRLSKDKIIIKIYGTTPVIAGRLLPLEIYTFSDNNFIDKVDENTMDFDTALLI